MEVRHFCNWPFHGSDRATKDCENNYLDLYLISETNILDDSSDVEISEIAIVAIHTSPNVAVKEIEALDEVRKWVTKR